MDKHYLKIEKIYKKIYMYTKISYILYIYNYDFKFQQIFLKLNFYKFI